jgi:hypothetical protein
MYGHFSPDMADFVPILHSPQVSIIDPAMAGYAALSWNKTCHVRKISIETVCE